MNTKIFRNDQLVMTVPMDFVKGFDEEGAPTYARGIFVNASSLVGATRLGGGAEIGDQIKTNRGSTYIITEMEQKGINTLISVERVVTWSKPNADRDQSTGDTGAGEDSAEPVDQSGSEEGVQYPGEIGTEEPGAPDGEETSGADAPVVDQPAKQSGAISKRTSHWSKRPNK